MSNFKTHSSKTDFYSSVTAGNIAGRGHNFEKSYRTLSSMEQIPYCTVYGSQQDKGKQHGKN
jgi:hypothetical protein